MRPEQLAIVCGWLLICLAPAGFGADDPGRVRPTAPGILAQALGGGAGTWTQAQPGRRLHFPADHGAHPDFRTEWWYLTGHLWRSDRPRRPLPDFGMQFTVFRQGLGRGVATGQDDAGVSQVWMAHTALTDLAAGQHRHEARLQRDDLGVAGVRLAPLAITFEDWQLRAAAPIAPSGPLQVPPTTPHWPASSRLRFTVQGREIDLTLRPTRPMILQGELGWSAKSADGAASHYYSIPGLHAIGTIRPFPAGAAGPATEVPVEGMLWLDREWGSAVLGRDQTGWDWFSLQLDDGTVMTLFRIRGRQPFRYGLRVGADGTEVLASDRWSLTPGRVFEDEVGGRWPIHWRLQLDDRVYEVEALLPDQLMRSTVRYWEGAVRVRGAGAGLGYLEMTGYGPRS